LAQAIKRPFSRQTPEERGERKERREKKNKKKKKKKRERGERREDIQILNFGGECPKKKKRSLYRSIFGR